MCADSASRAKHVVVIVKWLRRLGGQVLERARASEELDELEGVLDEPLPVAVGTPDSPEACR
jgi:hypothetical protein